MMHCDNCGNPIERDTDGTWVHNPSPSGFDPVCCVLGTVDGRAYGANFTADPGLPREGVTADPCTDKSCSDDPGAPWWLEHVKE